MKANRARDSSPEVIIRSLLHGMGLRFRKHYRPVPGLRCEADAAFPRAKVAVFVDGCFWHGCPEHGRREHAINGEYWPAKIEGNRARDADTDERLRAAEWRVVRVWEHADLISAAREIEQMLRDSD